MNEDEDGWDTEFYFEKNEITGEEFKSVTEDNGAILYSKDYREEGKFKKQLGLPFKNNVILKCFFGGIGNDEPERGDEFDMSDFTTADGKFVDLKWMNEGSRIVGTLSLLFFLY